MGAIIQKYRLFYASVPKVACTSLKRALFEVENGFGYRPFYTNGKRWHIHRLYRPIELTEALKAELHDYWRVAFVRDPLERFLSAYSNRMVYHNQRSLSATDRANLKRHRLTDTPDIHTFINNFETYVSVCRDIKHHTRPMVEFLGTDPRYFHRLFRMSEMNEFEMEIKKRTGVHIEVQHAQAHGTKIPKEELSNLEIEKIKKLYKQDYNIFGQYF